MMGHINPDLLHDLNGHRIHPNRMRTCTSRLKIITGDQPEQSLGHLAPDGITSA